MDKKEGNKGRRPHGRKGDPKKWDTAPVTLDSEARLQNEKTLKNKFAPLKENSPTIEELNEIISASIQELNENAMKTYTTSEKDPEIENMEEERKQLRAKENKTTEEKN